MKVPEGGYYEVEENNVGYYETCDLTGFCRDEMGAEDNEKGVCAAVYCMRSERRWPVPHVE